MANLRSKLKNKIQVWRKDRVLFAKEAFNITPTDQQAIVMRAFAKKGAKVAVASGHGCGKTSLMAILALGHILLYPDSKSAATAPTASQLKDVLMAEIGKILQRANSWIKAQYNYSSMRVEVKGREQTQFLTARTARKEQPDSLQGLHATNMAYFIDEAFGVHDSIFEVARGALSTPDSRVLMIGNPTSTTGYAYNAFHRNKRLWDAYHFSCLDSPLVSDQYPEEMRQEYGEDSDIYRIRVLGQFPKASICQFIPTNIVEAAMARKMHISAYDFAPRILGVDVAYFGDDRSTIVLRQGLHSQILGSWYDLEPMQLANLVAQFEDEHKAVAVFVDVNGVGAGVASRLRQLGREPIGVYFQAKPIKPTYHNKRAECWGEMKDWIKNGAVLPTSDALKEDLISPEYMYTTSGKIQLERKKDMKKRGLSSPDLADALALTFAAPVYMPHPYEQYDQSSNNTVETDYELF